MPALLVRLFTRIARWAVDRGSATPASYPAPAAPQACRHHVKVRGCVVVVYSLPIPPAAGGYGVECLTPGDAEALAARLWAAARLARSGGDGASLAGELPGEGVPGVP